jgi:hypothetical protein
MSLQISSFHHTDKLLYWQIFKAITPEGYDTEKVVMVVLNFLLRLDRRQRKLLQEFAMYKELGLQGIKHIMATRIDDSSELALQALIVAPERIWQPESDKGEANFAEKANHERRQHNAATGFCTYMLLRTLINLRPEQFLGYISGQDVDAGSSTQCLDNIVCQAASEQNPKTFDFFNQMSSYPAWGCPGAADREIIFFYAEFCKATGKGDCEKDADCEHSLPALAASAAPSKRRTLGARPRGSHLSPTPSSMAKKLSRQQQQGLLTSSEEEEKQEKPASSEGTLITPQRKRGFRPPSQMSGQQTMPRPTVSRKPEEMPVPVVLGPESAATDTRSSRIQSAVKQIDGTILVDLSDLDLTRSEVLDIMRLATSFPSVRQAVINIQARENSLL